MGFKYMKNFNIITQIIIVILLSACEREKPEGPPDWKSTEYKFLILDSNQIEFDTRCDFYLVNDSTAFLSGNNRWTGRDCFYKLTNIGNDLKIMDMRSVIDGYPYEIKDISFANQNTGYLLMNDRVAATGVDSKLYKTFDGGESWNEISTNVRNLFRRIHFISADSGIALSENYIDSCHEIYTTTDGGNNWQKIINEYFTGADAYLSDFYFIPQKPRICFLSIGRKLYYSMNGGFNWNLHSTHNLDIVSMSFLDENTGFVANFSTFPETSTTPNSIYKINKIGGDYIRVYSGDDNIFKIQAKNEYEVYFCKWFKLFCTYDGFNTVNKMTIQNPSTIYKGNRNIIEFTIFTPPGILIDTKGTLYLRNN
jgi:hypothetical protein